MIALLIDSFANSVAVEVASENSDLIPDIIRENHPDVLTKMGVTDNLKDADNHLKTYSTKWKDNVRVFSFDALYTDEYLELYILAVDHKKTKYPFTVIFVDETGDHKIFLTNSKNEEIALSDVKDQVCETGFNWCADNVEEIFTKEWVKHRMIDYDQKVSLYSNVSQVEWNKDYPINEFARLRSFIIKN